MTPKVYASLPVARKKRTCHYHASPEDYQRSRYVVVTPEYYVQEYIRRYGPGQPQYDGISDTQGRQIVACMCST